MLFRRTDRYGYARYNGGGGPAFIIKLILVLALALALLLGAAAVGLQKYMVYTENGGHLELPWSKPGASDSADLPPTPLEDVVVHDGSQSEEESTDSTNAAEGSDGAVSAEQKPEDSQAEGSAAESAPSEGQTAEPQPEEEEKTGFFGWLSGLFGGNKQDPAQPDASNPAPDSSADQSSEKPAVNEDTPAQKPEEASKPEEPKKPEVPADLPGGIRIEHVSMGDLVSDYADGVVSDADGNGMMLYMKESSGSLNYDSSLDLANELDVSGDSETSSKVESTVAQFKKDKLYSIAYIDCFRDKTAGNEDDFGLRDEEGSTWYDGSDRPWADPGNAAFQDYLISIMKDMSAMGFDEIVLNNSGYPSSGEFDILDADQYDSASLSKNVSAFYKKVAAAMKGSKTLVSVIVTSDTITEGADERTGITLKNAKQLGGRLWVEADADEAGELEKALNKAGYPKNALGLLVSRLDEDVKTCQMNLD